MDVNAEQKISKQIKIKSYILFQQIKQIDEWKQISVPFVMQIEILNFS